MTAPRSRVFACRSSSRKLPKCKKGFWLNGLKDVSHNFLMDFKPNRTSLENPETRTHPCRYATLHNHIAAQFIELSGTTARGQSILRR